MKMTNFQCKKLDPLVVGDIGDYCVNCLQSTAFGSGRSYALWIVAMVMVVQ